MTVDDGTYPTHQSELLYEISQKLDQVIDLLQKILDRMPGRP